MASHDWGEDDFDWCALNDACNFFTDNMKRFARCLCLTKEKYGTMRFEYFDCTFGRFEIGTLILFTNWINVRYKKLYWFDYKYTAPIARKLGVTRLLCMYQRFVFNIITVFAVRKWPHIKDEILNEHEFDILLYDYVKKRIGYTNNWVTCTVNSITTPDKFREEL